MSDRAILYAGAFLRSAAVGMIGVLLGTYLPRVGTRPAVAGLVVAAGLAGATAASMLATFAGDRLGRKGFLVAAGSIGGLGTAAMALAGSTAVLAAAAFLGMVNGMGRDRGAALVVEQSILPATASGTGRTRAFAWYNVVQDSGHAAGGLLATLPAVLHRVASVGEVPALRIAIGLDALLVVASGLVMLRLSAAAEAPRSPRGARVSGETRRILWRIGPLFALDSLGGGFLTTTLVSLFFFERFHADETVLGPLFAAARIANALSHLAAAWLARRFGLVNTMVFTHIPSSLLLATVPFAPSFPVAAVLFLLRESLVEMDVPTRQSYVMAVVRPEERTLASGITHVVRTGGWALGPSLAGLLMQGVSLGSPLLIGAATKVAYDVLLYVAFRGRRPPEETAAGIARDPSAPARHPDERP